MKYLLPVLFLSISNCIWAQSNEPDFKNVEDYINFRASHNRYSGTTNISKNGETVFEHVKGLANRSWDIPNQTNTRFNLASVTKMFTATGVGILLDRGQINLEDKISDHFPDFPNQSIAESTTIKALLSHTSGLSGFFFESAYLKYDRNRLRNLEDYDQFLSTLRKGEVPENQILYSNTNFMILGRIIEQITDISYYDFIQSEIFDKVGMNESGFFESDIPIKNLAEGYFIDAQAATEFGVPNDGQLRNNRALKAVKGMPAGGAYATANDIQKFMAALRAGKLLKKSTYELMTKEVKGGYGLGFQSYEHRGVKVIGHSGGFYGVSTMVFYLPQYDYTFVSLTNTDFGAQPVFDRFIDLINGYEPFDPVKMEANDIKKFEGYFEVYEGMMQGRQISIEAQSDRLKFDKVLDFFPIAEDAFFDIDNDHFTLTFIKNEQGEIVEFIRKDDRGFLQKARKISPDAVNKIQALNIPDELLEDYLGEYQFQEGGMMAGHKPNIQIDQGGLMIDNAMLFKPYERDKFFLNDDIGMRLIFQRDSNGELTGIEVKREAEVVGTLKKLN